MKMKPRLSMWDKSWISRYQVLIGWVHHCRLDVHLLGTSYRYLSMIWVDSRQGTFKANTAIWIPNWWVSVHVKLRPWHSVSNGMMTFCPLCLCRIGHSVLACRLTTPPWLCHASEVVSLKDPKQIRSSKPFKASNKPSSIHECVFDILWIRVTKVSSDKKSTSRPHALNTVEMLKAASSGLGIGPSDAVQLLYWFNGMLV